MPVKKYKPTTPSRRFMSVSDFSDLTKKDPEKSLLAPNPKKAGRNCHGRITMRRRGGGHKRQYRIIDFRREKDGVPGKVSAIEYDPNRSARIALIVYADGEKRYILAPLGLEVGDEIVSSTQRVDPRPGNCMPIREIPLGMPVQTSSSARAEAGSWFGAPAPRRAFPPRTRTTRT